MAEVTKRDNTLYPSKYGEWAGFPQGHKPDYERCCAEVYNSTTRHYSQCSKKRGHGPGGAYCATHNPAAVKARKDKQRAAYDLRVDYRRYEIFGATFFNALKQIAEGHNDARGLAQEVLDRFNGKR